MPHLSQNLESTGSLFPQFRPGKVVRNIAFDLWKKNHRQKRYAGMEQFLNELEDCIQSSVIVEREIEERELTGLINSWLASLPQDDCILFMRLYWNGDISAEALMSVIDSIG